MQDIQGAMDAAKLEAAAAYKAENAGESNPTDLRPISHTTDAHPMMKWLRAAGEKHMPGDAIWDVVPVIGWVPEIRFIGIKVES